MITRTAIKSTIFSAVLIAGTATPCQARSPFIASAYAAQAPPADTLPPDTPPQDSPPGRSPIVSQKTVPLGGNSPQRLVHPNTLTVSPDSANVAYQLRYGSQLQYDGYIYNDHNPIGTAKTTSPTFAPDSKSVAVVRVDRGWKLQHDRDWLDGYEPVTPVRFSPDGKRLIYLAKLDNQRFVVEGDLPQPLAQAIRWDQLVFTPDSTNLAYPAFDGQHWRMVINGDPGPTWQRFTSPPITAHNGPRVLYVAMKHGRYHVVDRHTPAPGESTSNTGENYGGNAGGNTGANSGGISGGGGGGGGGGKVVGGSNASGAGFLLIDQPPVLSGDGKTFVYWALGDDQTWRVYKNHLYVPGYDADRPGQLILSHDGQTLAAILKRDNHWLVVRNGKQSPPYAAVGNNSLTLSPDGQRLVYAIKNPRGWAIVDNGSEQPTYTQLAPQSLRFSPDSQRLAYAALNQGQWSVILNDTPDPTHAPNTLALKPLADSRSPIPTLSPVMAPGALAGVTPTQHLAFNQINAHSLTFSPDSQHLAYIAYNAGRATVILDSQPLGEYEHAQQLTFSPNSYHLVYFAQLADQSFLAVDGTPSTERFDQPVPGSNIHFTNVNNCHTLAIRRPGPTFARIELKLRPIPDPKKTPPNNNGTPAPPVPAEPMSPFVDVPTE